MLSAVAAARLTRFAAGPYATSIMSELKNINTKLEAEK